MFLFIWKQCRKNFAFLILRILKLFTCEVCKFLESRLIFNISHVRISHKVNGILTSKLQHIIFIWKWTYFADFEISITVPIKQWWSKTLFQNSCGIYQLSKIFCLKYVFINIFQTFCFLSFLRMLQECHSLFSPPT